MSDITKEAQVYKLLILLPILASACFPGPRYTTAQGVVVYCRDTDQCWDRTMVEAAIDAVISEIASEDQEAYGEVLSAGLQIYVDSRDLTCRAVDGSDYSCQGRYYAGFNQVDVRYRECIAQSALVHELVHAYDVYVLGTRYPDPSQIHSNTDLYSTQCGDDTGCKASGVVARATAQIYGWVQWCGQ